MMRRDKTHKRTDCVETESKTKKLQFRPKIRLDTRKVYRRKRNLMRGQDTRMVKRVLLHQSLLLLHHSLLLLLLPKPRILHFFLSFHCEKKRKIFVCFLEKSFDFVSTTARVQVLIANEVKKGKKKKKRKEKEKRKGEK